MDLFHNDCADGDIVRRLRKKKEKTKERMNT